MPLPTNIAGSYPDRGPGDTAHQEHHDAIHAAVNEVTEGRLSESGLNAAMADVTEGLAGASKLPRIIDVTTNLETTTTPRVIDHHGGYFWGTTSDQKVWRSADGDTWTEVASPGFRPSRILPTGDGEMIAANGPNLIRSTGWATSPATATWATVLTTTNGANGFPNFGFDSNSTGTKFIAIEYGADRTNSNKVYISTDSGATWATVYDTAVEFPADYTISHVHACCYDETEDRFWFADGHNAAKGLYYSDDDGATWAKLTADMYDPDGAPMTLNATKHGIVCGSDSSEAVLWLIPRADDPADMRLQILARWRGAILGGAPGGPEQSYTDANTGLVYVIWSNGADPTYPASIWVTDGLTAREFHTVDAGGTTVNSRHVVANGGRVFAAWQIGDDEVQMQAGTSAVYPAEPATNEGNIAGGIAPYQSGVAIGPRAKTTSTHALAIGVRSLAAGESVAVGSEATTGTGTQAVAVGRSCQATGNDAVAVGYNAKATTPYAFAMGANTTSSGSNSVAIGKDATASGADAMAIGRGASNPGWGRSVAIGSTSTVSAADQIAVGGRHFEITEVSAPDTPAINKARLYVKDDGAGKTQLVVKFSDGAEHVLAVQA